MNKKHFFLILFTTTILATSLNEPTNIKTLPAILPEYETFTTTRTYITPTCDCIISTSPLGPQGHWESYCRNNTLKLKITRNAEYNTTINISCPGLSDYINKN